jgi:hypothetical protein
MRQQVKRPPRTLGLDDGRRAGGSEDGSGATHDEDGLGLEGVGSGEGEVRGAGERSGHRRAL